MNAATQRFEYVLYLYLVLYLQLSYLVPVALQLIKCPVEVAALPQASNVKKTRPRARPPAACV